MFSFIVIPAIFHSEKSILENLPGSAISKIKRVMKATFFFFSDSFALTLIWGIRFTIKTLGQNLSYAAIGRKLGRYLFLPVSPFWMVNWMPLTAQPVTQPDHRLMATASVLCPLDYFGLCC